MKPRYPSALRAAPLSKTPPVPAEAPAQLPRASRRLLRSYLLVAGRRRHGAGSGETLTDRSKSR